MLITKSKRLLTLAGLSAFAAWGSLYSAAPEQPSSTKEEKTNQDSQLPSGFTKEEINKLSEAFGHFIGRNLNNPGVHFDLESIIRGLRSGYAGNPAPMSDQEYEKLMTKLQESAFDQLSQENLKAANTFLEKNKKAEGVIELEPGKLQFIVLQKGTGPEVKAEDVPQINYVGKFIDGSTFGSSEEVGGPITIPLSTSTLKGLTQGLIGMKEGEKRRLFVHPDLAYGAKGAGQLPPNALLIFEVEVVKANTPGYKPPTLPNLSAALKKDGKNPMDADDEDEDDDYDDEENEDDENEEDHHHHPHPQKGPTSHPMKPASQATR